MDPIKTFLDSTRFSSKVDFLITDFNLPIDLDETLEYEIGKFVVGESTKKQFLEILNKNFEISIEEGPEVVAYIDKKITPLAPKEAQEKKQALTKTEEEQAIKETVVEKEIKKEEVPKSTIQMPEATEESAEPHTELMVPPHLEPMIIEQPKVVPTPVKVFVKKQTPEIPVNLPVENNQPIPQIPVETTVAPTPAPISIPIVEEKKEESADTFNRHDILSDIENPEPTVFTTQQKPQPAVNTINQPTLKNPGTPVYEQKLNQTVRLPRQEQKVTDPYREALE